MQQFNLGKWAKKCWSAALLGAGLLAASSSLSAEEPRFTFVQPGADRLREDLKYLVNLSPPALKKEWENLDATLESFLAGVDGKTPIRVDVLLGDKEIFYQLNFPITKLEGRDGFLDNVASFGYTVKKNAAGHYDLTEQGASKRKYFLRTNGKYAMLGQRLQDIPANAPDPGKQAAALLGGSQDIVADLKNDPSTLAQRQTDFAKLRTELEAAVKFKRDEAKEVFELRKLVTAHQLAELQRFIVESEHLQGTWTTDIAGTKGVGTFLLRAIPGTDLATSIDLLGTKESAFSAIKLHEKPVISGKICFEIDELRKKHAAELYPVMNAAIGVNIEGRPNLTAEGKAAAKEFSNEFFAQLTSGIPMGVLDAYIDLHEIDGGVHNMTCGILAADTSSVAKLTTLLPKIRDDWKVETDVAEHAGVKIHKLTFPARRLEGFQSVFGKDQSDLLIGVGKEIVWGAAGKGAMDELKAAIDTHAAGPKAVNPVVLSGTIKFGPTVRVLEIFRDNTPVVKTGKTKAELDRIKKIENLRKLAVDAFAEGDDLFTFSLERKDKDVVGEINANQGILRYVGSVIANFSKEALR
ncbi:MAG: hypothetical protein C0478_05185 [Planctomyces sp.]|nr:hypothetical protein [Planctomyces sp.]